MESRRPPTGGAQRIPFVLDNHLINHLVYDQSTTVENAILELVMNAIDAGAPAVKVEITA